jgi:hypothetical protein
MFSHKWYHATKGNVIGITFNILKINAILYEKLMQGLGRDQKLPFPAGAPSMVADQQ